MSTDKKGILKNTLYTIGGALVLNGVLQLFVYPRLTAEMGAEQIGNVIYIMGLINILGPSVGQSLNTSRLVVRRDYDVTNGDYDATILIFSAVGIPIILLASGGALGGWTGGILAAVLSLLTVLRFYGDVEYRLNLSYRRYFIYYVCAGAGYLAGYLLYRLTGSWYPVFLTGEAFALAYVTLKGSVFRHFLARGENFRIVFSKGLTLALSYLLTNTTLNIDRIVLKNMIGATSVTQYYVVSLIGKTLVLLIAPVNTIIISYLTREKAEESAGRFYRLAGAGLCVSLVFFGLCQIATPLFVRIFYPTLYTDILPYVTVVNITQILGMLSAYLFIVVLTFTDAKWQLILQAGHLVILLALVLAMTRSGGLPGFSWAVMLANTIRVAAVLVLGTVSVRKRKETENESR